MFARSILFFALLFMAVPAFSLSSYDFSKLKGYTVVEVTYVKGDFEGADFDKLVELDNGWIMRFNEYHYHYAYHPTAVVFAKNVNGVFLFKLLIEDHIYDVMSVK
jgi:hypothetical protein